MYSKNNLVEKKSLNVYIDIINNDYGVGTNINWVVHA